MTEALVALLVEFSANAFVVSNGLDEVECEDAVILGSSVEVASGSWVLGCEMFDVTGDETLFDTLLVVVPAGSFTVVIIVLEDVDGVDDSLVVVVLACLAVAVVSSAEVDCDGATVTGLSETPLVVVSIGVVGVVLVIFKCVVFTTLGLLTIDAVVVDITDEAGDETSTGILVVVLIDVCFAGFFTIVEDVGNSLVVVEVIDCDRSADVVIEIDFSVGVVRDVVTVEKLSDGFVVEVEDDSSFIVVVAFGVVVVALTVFEGVWLTGLVLLSTDVLVTCGDVSKDCRIIAAVVLLAVYVVEAVCNCVDGGVLVESFEVVVAACLVDDEMADGEVTLFVLAVFVIVSTVVFCDKVVESDDAFPAICLVDVVGSGGVDFLAVGSKSLVVVAVTNSIVEAEDGTVFVVADDLGG